MARRRRKADWRHDMAGALYPLALAAKHAVFSLAAGAVETLEDAAKTVFLPLTNLRSELWNQANRVGEDRNQHRALQMMVDKQVAMTVAESVAEINGGPPGDPDPKKEAN